MNEIVKKHYTEEILIESCRRFEINHSEAKLIRGNSNLIYDCGDKILRISHSEIRDFNDIEIEIDWIKFLRKNKLSVVDIVKSINKKELERIGGDDHFTIVCFEKIIGNKINSDNWDGIHFEKLGNFVGLLHKVGQKYEEKRNLKYKNWNEIDEFYNYKYLNRDDKVTHDKLIKEFESYSKPEEYYGLIHYDFHHGNYLMSAKDEDIILFDFEMICRSWYVNDIATVLYYAKHFTTVREETNFEDRFLKHFWKGYEIAYKIEDVEKEKIPKFLLYRDLLVLGFINKIWKSKDRNENQKKYVTMIEESILKRKANLNL